MNPPIAKWLAVLTLAAPLTGHTAPQQVPQQAAVCASCHGEAGARPIMPAYPVLAGQYANYLEHALRQYRSGERGNPVMKAQAAALKDQDIKALARYFSEQKGPLYTPTASSPGSGNSE